jgi:predicted ArsR family transcriptional regulator
MAGSRHRSTQMSLSPAATIVLTRAAERPDGRLEFHRKLPTAARHKMIDALLRQGLIVETQGDYRLGNGSLLIESTATGLMLTTLALTDTGLRAIGRDTDETPAATEADTAPPAASDEAVAQEALAVADALDAATMAPTQRDTTRTTLRQAAAAVLEEWDDRDNQQYGLPQAIEQLRAILATKAVADGVTTPRKPREGTKQEAVLTMLRRAEGATVAQIAEAMGWATHTVRGFLAGLKKKGVTVAVLERVRQVGPNREGAKGSFSVYQAVG